MKSTRLTTRRPKKGGSKNNKNNKNTRAVMAPPSAYGTRMPASGYQVSRRTASTCVIKGHEYLVQVAKEDATQFLVAAYDMNPATWSGSRLVNVARSYELYRYNRAHLKYVPAVGTNQIGTMSMGFETDPNEPLPAIGNFFQRSLANQFSTLGPTWSNLEAHFVRPGQDVRWFNCSTSDADRRTTSQLMAYAVTNAPTTSLIYGFLMVEYEIEFMYPELEFDGFTAGQFSTATVPPSPALSIGGVVQATGFGTANTILESIALVDIPDLETIQSRIFTLLAGEAIYWAATGTGIWQAYRTLESARAAAGPILTRIARAANWLPRFITRPYAIGNTV